MNFIQACKEEYLKQLEENWTEIKKFWNSKSSDQIPINNTDEYDLRNASARALWDLFYRVHKPILLISPAIFSFLYIDKVLQLIFAQIKYQLRSRGHFFLVQCSSLIFLPIILVFKYGLTFVDYFVFACLLIVIGGIFISISKLASYIMAPIAYILGGLFRLVGRPDLSPDYLIYKHVTTVKDIMSEARRGNYGFAVDLLYYGDGGLVFTDRDQNDLANLLENATTENNNLLERLYQKFPGLREARNAQIVSLGQAQLDALQTQGTETTEDTPLVGHRTRNNNVSNTTPLWNHCTNINASLLNFIEEHKAWESPVAVKTLPDAYNSLRKIRDYIQQQNWLDTITLEVIDTPVILLQGTSEDASKTFIDINTLKRLDQEYQDGNRGPRFQPPFNQLPISATGDYTIDFKAAKEIKQFLLDRSEELENAANVSEKFSACMNELKSHTKLKC